MGMSSPIMSYQYGYSHSDIHQTNTDALFKNLYQTATVTDFILIPIMGNGNHYIGESIIRQTLAVKSL